MRLVILILALLPLSLKAQVIVSGKITDTEGEGIPGVNVFLKNTFDGSSTDAMGNFKFSTLPADTFILIATSIGYEDIEILLNETENLELTMKPKVNELNAVQITSGTINMTDKTSSVIMKPLDILTTAGAIGDITGALNTLPGTVTVANDGRLFVRGGSAEETGVYFDGLRVGNAYGSSADNMPTRNRFNPALFKGVHFSTGGYSAEFGNALSSVLALESIDRPVRDQTDISLMSVGLSAATTVVGESQSVSGDISIINLGPYQELIDQNIDWLDAPSSVVGQLVYRHDLGKEGLLKTFFQGSRSLLKFRQRTPDETDAGTLIGIENGFGFGEVSYKIPWSKKWLASGGISLSLNEDKFSIDSSTYQFGDMLLHVKQKFTNYPSDAVKLTFGAENIYREYSESDLQQNAEREFDNHSPAAFVEMEWYLSPKWTIRPGLRGVYGSLNQSFDLEPRFSAAYQPYPSGTVSLAVGRFSQPQDKEILVLSPELESAKAVHYQVGFQHEHSGRVFRAEFYYKDYSDFALRESETWTVNGWGKATGVDFFYRDKKTISNADFWITYGYVHSRRRYENFQTLIQPDFAPTHNFSAVAKYWIDALNSQPGASFTWNSGYTFDNPNLSGEMESVSKAYASLSVNWSYLLRQNLIIYGSCSNVTGRENIFGFRYAETPEESGNIGAMPIEQSATRFVFIGVFWTISKDKQANQLNNL